MVSLTLLREYLSMRDRFSGSIQDVCGGLVIASLIVVTVLWCAP